MGLRPRRRAGQGSIRTPTAPHSISIDERTFCLLAVTVAVGDALAGVLRPSTGPRTADHVRFRVVDALVWGGGSAVWLPINRRGGLRVVPGPVVVGWGVAEGCSGGADMRYE